MKMKLKYLKRKFRFNKKRSYFFIFLFLLVCSVGLGYAAISTTLSIDGSAEFKDARWIVYFDNLNVTTGSITATTPASITNTTTVSFGVKLDNPGDFYEFTVDVVNGGNMNAMIDSVNVLPELTAAQQNYLRYTFTYSNGVPLAQYQKLDVGDTETILVRFEYLENDDTSLYPTEDDSLTIAFDVTYVQADDHSVEIGTLPIVCESGTFLPANSNECVSCEAGSSCPGGEFEFNEEEIQGTSFCPVGTYSLDESSSCISCPAGSYQDEAGQTVCKVCANGKTSDVGYSSTCSINCSNYDNVDTWVTPTWNTNNVDNLCVPNTCVSGYSLSDGKCRKIVTVTFDYNNAKWNSTTTRTCLLNDNGVCSVTAPGIPSLNLNTSNSNQSLGLLFNSLGWNSSSSANTASYASTATITVSDDTTYYAVISLARSSVVIDAGSSGINVRTGPGSSYPKNSGGNGVISGVSCTITDYSYVSDSCPLWLKSSNCGYDDYRWFCALYVKW